MFDDTLACLLSAVRYGSKADAIARISNVRFAP